MPVSIGDLRTGLADTIGSRVDALTVHATVPAAVHPKCVVIVPQRGAAVTMGRGVTVYTLNAVCVAASADSQHGQQVLDEMLDAEGPQVMTAVEANQTLGLEGVSAHVAGWDDYGTTDFGETTYYTATIPVEIVVTKGA